MKAGITIVLAVLALAVLAAAQGTSLSLTLEGKSTPKNPSSSVADRKWEHDLTATTATGQCVGTLSGDTEFKRHKKFKDVGTTEIPADPRCSNAPKDPKHPSIEKKWGSNLKKVEWTLTCSSGSKSGTLKGKATNPSVKSVCTDGSQFYIKAEGNIQSGTGDFQGAKGTWTGEMTVDRACCTPAVGSTSCNTGSCTTTGTLEVNFK